MLGGEPLNDALTVRQAIIVNKIVERALEIEEMLLVALDFDLFGIELVDGQFQFGFE